MTVKIKKEKPFESEKGAHGEQYYQHPAFGLATVSRVSVGGGMHLFNSALKHHDIITVSVSSAELMRNLNSYTVFRKGLPFIEFSLSEMQWAQLVASIGQGDGVPVTLKSVTKGDVVQMPEIESGETVKETFAKEMKDKTEDYMKDVNTIINRLSQLANSSGSVSKIEFRKLLRDLKIRSDNLPSNLAFTQTQFASAMEKTIESGKMELEGFVRNALMKKGIEALAGSSNPIVELPGPSVKKLK